MIFFFFTSATVTAVGEADTMKLVALAVMLSCYFVHTYCDECSVDEIQIIQQQWTSTFSNNAVRLFEFGVAFFLRLALLREFVTVIIVLIERHKLHNFRDWLRKTRYNTMKCVTAINGHPRSLISVPVLPTESAYATSYQ